MGAYSVWHPRRSTALTETESDYNISTFNFKFRKAVNSGPGLALQGIVRGPICSSTRTELAGFINAIFAPGPVHYACDNAAVVKQAQAIIRDPFQKPHKPWGIRRDGDLWGVLQHAICSKKPTSVAISKVKGHATEQDVLDGVAERCHKDGNDASDELVSDAYKLHGDGLLSLTNLCGTRHAEYTEFMTACIHMVVDIYKTDRDLRARIQAQQNAIGRGPKQLHNIPKSLGYADACDARSIGLHDFFFMPKDFTHAPAQCYRSIWAFLAVLRIQPVDPPNVGITWIELLVIYNLFGGLHDLSPDGHASVPCKRMQTTKQELMQFQRLTRAVVKHFAFNHDQKLFKAPPTTGKRLLPLGFSNHAAKLAFLPLLDDLQSRQVTKALLTMRGKFTRGHAANLAAGSLCLPRVLLTLRRQPRWRTQLNVVDTISDRLPPPPQGCQDFRPLSHTDSVNYSRARDFLDDLYLVCRSCTTRRAAGKINPRRGYAWAIITCGNRSCRQARPANAWNCTCQIPWRSCSFHAQWLTHANTARLLAESPRKERTKRTKWQSLDPPRILAKRARAAEDKLPTALDAQRPPHGPQSTLNQGVDRAGNDPFFSNQKGGGLGWRLNPKPAYTTKTPPPFRLEQEGQVLSPPRAGASLVVSPPRADASQVLSPPRADASQVGERVRIGARTSAGSVLSSSSSSFSAAPAASPSARFPKRVAPSQMDQQGTRRLLAKMPKLAAKFSHLAAQAQKETEEGCRKHRGSP